MKSIPQHLSLSNEHYTPPSIIEKARLTMGSIDIDPASCELANTLVRANQFYTKEDDGLIKRWRRNVFLNPPGGKTKNKSNQAIWLREAVNRYLCSEIDQLIFISFNIESLRHCGDLLEGNHVCVPKERLKYYSEYAAGDLKEGQMEW